MSNYYFHLIDGFIGRSGNTGDRLEIEILDRGTKADRLKLSKTTPNYICTFRVGNRKYHYCITYSSWGWEDEIKELSDE